MFLQFLIVLGGIAAVLLLGELLIRNAVALARHFHLSGGFIGLTVLSIGTTVPEIMTNVVGSLRIVEHPDSLQPISGLVLGTNVGSGIFQQTFLLALVGLVGTVVVKRKELTMEVGALLTAGVLLWFASLDGTITRIEGALLIAAYLAYLAFLVKRNHLIDLVAAEAHNGTRRTLARLSVIIISFVGMGMITDRVVDTATALVAQLPVSASLFGVLILGIASALPELSTALVSILKGEREISAGILIGSNITNPLLGVGTGGIISGYAVPAVVIQYDLPVMIATALLLYIFLLRHDDLNRREALTLMIIYVVYILGRGNWYPADFPMLHGVN